MSPNIICLLAFPSLKLKSLSLNVSAGQDSPPEGDRVIDLFSLKLTFMGMMLRKLILTESQANSEATVQA